MSKLREIVEDQGIKVTDLASLNKAKKVEIMTLSGMSYKRALEEIEKLEEDKEA